MYIKPCPEKIRAARRKQGLSTHSLRAQAIADALGCPVEELFDAPGKKGKTA